MTSILIHTTINEHIKVHYINKYHLNYYKNGFCNFNIGPKQSFSIIKPLIHSNACSTQKFISKDYKMVYDMCKNYKCRSQPFKTSLGLFLSLFYKTIIMSQTF